MPSPAGDRHTVAPPSERGVLRIRPASRADVTAIGELIALSARTLSAGFYTGTQAGNPAR